jgi:hypothetical protein
MIKNSIKNKDPEKYADLDDINCDSERTSIQSLITQGFL